MEQKEYGTATYESEYAKKFHQIGQIGTRGKELNEKINQFISKNTWEKIPPQYREAILEGVRQGAYSGSHFADGTPKPIKSEWLTNLHPAVLGYKGVRSLLSRGLGIDPGLIDKVSIVKGLVSNIKPKNLGINQTITPGPQKPLSIKGQSPFASDKVVNITTSSPVTPKAKIPPTPTPPNPFDPNYNPKNNVMANRFMKIGRDQLGSTPGAQGATFQQIVEKIKLGRTLTSDVGRHTFGKKPKLSNQYYRMLNFVRQYGDEESGFGIASTSTHHRNQLVQIAEAAVNHPEGEKILNSEAFKNIPIGDEIENYTAILDHNTNALRRVKVDEIYKLHPNVPKKTIDDALGASDFKPTRITTNEAEQLKLIKSKDPTFTFDKFVEEVPRDTGRKFGKGSYPSIDFFDKDGIKTKWKPSDGEDWNKRWQIINEHYGSNINPKEFKKIKLDRDLATYAPDHAYLHKEILDSLPSHKGLDELIKSGKWEQLPYKQAEKILEKVSKDSLKASDRISKWRYGKIGEYFEKFKQDSKIPQEFKNKSWDELTTEIQRQFFKEHASPISRYGSRDIPKVNELMKGRKVLTNKEAAFFGVKRP